MSVHTSGFGARLRDATSGYELHHKDDEGYDEKDMDQAAPHAAQHSQEPKHQEYGEKCPEHLYLPPIDYLKVGRPLLCRLLVNHVNGCLMGTLFGPPGGPDPKRL